MHDTRDESASQSSAAATLTKKAMALRNATKYPRPFVTGNNFLHELVTRIFAKENDLDATLADLLSSPSTDADSDVDEPQVQVADANLGSYKIIIDISTKVNIISTAEGRRAIPPTSAEKYFDRAADDASFSSMMGADKSHGGALSPNHA